jgi:hypothetical protein
MSQFRTLTGSYALGALDEAQLAGFEAHLVSCRICQEQLAEFRETAAQLAWLTLATPPSELRSRILDAISTTRQAASQRLFVLRPADGTDGVLETGTSSPATSPSRSLRSRAPADPVRHRP